MNTVHIAVAVALILASTGPAYADPCAAIHDGDSRQECRARHTGDAGHCSLIRDPDRRARCRVEVADSHGRGR